MLYLYMKNIFIYVLKDPNTKNIRYVGQTNDIKRRFNRHLNNSKSFYDNRHISNWIRSLTNPPIIETIEICKYENRNVREKYWIDYYLKQGNNLCNSSYGGSGAGIGNKNCLGRKLSDDTKKKISNSNKGRTHSKSRKGIGGVKGKEVYQYDRNYNLINIFPSIKNAAEKLNLSRRTIKDSIKGIRTERIRHPFIWSENIIL